MGSTLTHLEYITSHLTVQFSAGLVCGMLIGMMVMLFFAYPYVKSEPPLPEQFKEDDRNLGRFVAALTARELRGRTELLNSFGNREHTALDRLTTDVALLFNSTRPRLNAAGQYLADSQEFFDFCVVHARELQTLFSACNVALFPPMYMPSDRHFIDRLVELHDKRALGRHADEG